MGWSLWSSSPAAPSSSSPNRPTETNEPVSKTTDPTTTSPPGTYPPVPLSQKKKSISWNDSLNATNWDHFTEPRVLIPNLLVVGFAVGLWAFYRSYLRRLARAQNIDPSYFHRRSLLGKVTSVGDGDGFHLFHTPGGRLAGWGWLRRVPQDRKELKGHTISVRLAGVDAPEGAHFGKPAQPYAAEALEFLKSYILGKRVRAYVYKRDQYERVVASVYVRKPPFFLRKDVSKELLKRGLATVYESKTGGEYGGPVMREVYNAAQETAKRKRKGMWSVERAGFFGIGKREALETPRAYKDRIRKEEAGIKEKV
ncbi:hypothetical protein QBC47DRAFT_399156 [Echria macrotheca]|uniref:Probable endonuclease LCL3 n=1 Tax=Echria macrotheca TaxID=438768 RepID=A0AAJ0FEK6_9PEZI|nr:hypothetical protein QBC47DRAFT_399156 [Echria macrotheca]